MLSAKNSAKNYFPRGYVLLWLLLFLGFLFAMSIFIHLPLTIDGVGVLLLNGAMGQVVSHKQGTIENWLVEEGDKLAAGDAIVTIREAQPPQSLFTIHAHSPEVVAEIVAHAGSVVGAGEPIAFTTHLGDVRKNLGVVGFVSSLDGKRIHAGMRGRVDPSITSKYREGTIGAQVVRVGKLPTTESAIQSLVKVPEIARYLRTKLQAEPFLVILSLDQDESHVSGYRWSGVGSRFELDSGVLVTLEIVYENPRVLALVWPSLDNILFGANQ